MRKKRPRNDPVRSLRLAEPLGILERLRTVRRAANDARSQSPSAWANYETLKARWIEAHPDASNEEYEQAMQRLADQSEP